MKLYFLGTCAGTEPMPDRKHTAFVLESQGTLYWFDAGEGCSYTAHNMGLDLLNVGRIVISHPHMDHVGGLGNLLWNIRKLHWVRHSSSARDVDVYLPNLQTWEGITTILHISEGTSDFVFRLQGHKTCDGILFDDGAVRVTAFHNLHMQPLNSEWQSYSFLIECEGKRLVYSGDVKSYDELDPVIGAGCDALIIETGHFGISDVYAYTKDKDIGKVFFMHNGREVLNAPAASAEKVADLFQGSAVICFDGMSTEL